MLVYNPDFSRAGSRFLVDEEAWPLRVGQERDAAAARKLKGQALRGSRSAIKK